MSFGYSRYDWPGGFFAASQDKLLLARVLLDYDLAMRETQNGVRYTNVAVSDYCIADMKKELLFRRTKL